MLEKIARRGLLGKQPLRAFSPYAIAFGNNAYPETLRMSILNQRILRYVR